MEDLEALGWTEKHQARFSAQEAPDSRVARAAAVERGHLLLLGLGEPRLGKLSSRLGAADAGALARPTVGDWVACRQLPDAVEVTQVLPRTSCFVRKAPGREALPQLVAANVDQVLIVTALGDDLSARRMQRYAALVWAGGAEPVLVINKCDRAGDTVAARRELAAAVPGAVVVTTSALESVGLEDLTALLVPKTTVALVGSSGVGKSTIVNRLLGEQRFSTTDVRAADDKGRHTTTRRELVIAPSGVILIDTPGMREIGLWGAESGLSTAFADLEELAQGCRFRDCHHAGEPDCAVLRAVTEGLLPAERLESYRALVDETHATSNQARVRSIRKSMRSRRKLHKKLGIDDD